MAEDKDFRQRVQRIGALVEKIEGIADPAVRATAKELLQGLMELHGKGLERMLEITFQSGDTGALIIDELGRDPLAGSLLMLYSLHPEALETRVSNAVERIRPGLRKQGCEIELAAVEEGVVRIGIELTGTHTCGSTAKAIRSTVEEALCEAAPDITSLSIEGLDERASSGFVALEKLMGEHLSVALADSGSSSRVEGADSSQTMASEAEQAQL